MRRVKVVCAIRVEDLAVVTDLVKEVIGHVLGERDVFIAQQAELDEVTIPAVHFVEAAAGHNIGARKIEQALILDPRGIGGELADFDLLEVGGGHLSFEGGGDAGEIVFGRNINRPTAVGEGLKFGIDGGDGQVLIGAGQDRPHRADVILDRFGTLFGGRLSG